MSNAEHMQRARKIEDVFECAFKMAEVNGTPYIRIMGRLDGSTLVGISIRDDVRSLNVNFLAKTDGGVLPYIGNELSYGIGNLCEEKVAEQLAPFIKKALANESG
jgi:hypothetical protein